MALIQCPECGKEVSDKADKCIHCGYPFDKLKKNKDEFIEKPISKYEINGENIDISGVIAFLSINRDEEAESELIRISNLSSIAAKQYINEIKNTDIIDKNVIYREKIIENSHKDYVPTDNSVKCPKCGSTQIQVVPRRWSLATGFLTNKVDRVCLNCKHKF